jgi:phage baseplate assembly protein W
MSIPLSAETFLFAETLLDETGVTDDDAAARLEAQTRMASTPAHLNLPFRFDERTGHAAEVDQDSLDDIAVCVEAVLRTHPGQREEHPAFGSPDLIFREVPVESEDVIDALETWEPRARILVERDPDRFDTTLERLRITVGKEG